MPSLYPGAGLCPGSHGHLWHWGSDFEGLYRILRASYKNVICFSGVLDYAIFYWFGLIYHVVPQLLITNNQGLAETVQPPLGSGSWLAASIAAERLGR